MTTVLGWIFHTGCERTTTSGRAAMGLTAGALVGAMLVTLAIFIPSLTTNMGLVTLAGLFVFPIAFGSWGVGLLLSLPGWWLLHRLGARCQTAAVLYGFGFTFVVLLAMGTEGFRDTPPNGWVLALGWAGIMAVAGAVVGWVVAKVAYEPARP